MRIRLLEIRKGYARQKSVALYCLGIIKKIFVKVVRGKDISSALLVGDGMRKDYVGKCHCEIARCA